MCIPMRFSPSRWLALALASLLASCEADTDVEKTIPFNGQRDVAPRTIIAIQLDDIMTGLDGDNTEANKIIVTGDLTEGVYSGSIEMTDRDSVFNGQTADEFSNRPVATPQADPDDPSTVPERVDDTLVFLLDSGVSLKPGEHVRVFVSRSVTTRGTPLGSDKTFSFTVAGGAAFAEGDFFVTSTSPEQHEASARLAPTITATFSKPVGTSSLATGITVRGEQSGLRSNLRHTFQQSAEVTEVSTRLAAGESFVPGEWVEVVWGSAISSSGSDAGPLSPYLLRFQVRPGFVSGGWQERTIEESLGDVGVVGVHAAEFLPDTTGLEFAVVRESSLDLYVPTDQGTWVRRRHDVPVGTRIVRSTLVDVDDDGLPDVVAVRKVGEESQIQVYGVNEAGSLAPRDDPVVFFAGSIDGLAAADLNSDGTPELVVTHESVQFQPEEGAAEEEAGNLTFFELRMGVPDLDDLLDPDALLGLAYQRIGRPVARFSRSSRFEIEDLDGDGRLDLVTESEGGLVLYRNQSTTASPFTFRRTGVLPGRPGASAPPLAWALFDADGDRDVDIVTWDGQGALYHENRQPPMDSRTPDAAPSSEAAALGLLFEELEPLAIDLGLAPLDGSAVEITNIDGDTAGIADLVAFTEDGDLLVLTGGEGVGQLSEAAAAASSGSGVQLGLGDIDGDTGLDVLIASADGLRLLESDSVEPPPQPEPSSFRLVEVDRANDTLYVAVEGDLRAPFTAYSVALDYDESVLQYVGFKAPSAFERKASFTTCPNAQLQGCAGRASVEMQYLQSVVGSPVEGLELGVFRFRVPSVTERIETSIVLTDFEVAGGDSYANTVTVSEFGGTEDLAVTDLGDPLVVEILPPPPAPLAVDCVVDERRASSFVARIGWSSPRGTEFSTVRVDIGGDRTLTAPWNSGFVIVEDGHAGFVDVTVTALAEGEDPQDPPAGAPSVACGIISVFQPAVECVSNAQSNVIEWTLPHTVDRFNVFRNGAHIGVVQGDSEILSYEDRFPSAEGGDAYEVEAVLSGVAGPRGGCRGQDPSPCITRNPIIVSAVFQMPVATAPGALVRPRYHLLRYRWKNAEAYDRLVVYMTRTPPGTSVEEDVFPAGVDLPGGSTEFTYAPDPDRGGAAPGTYSLVIQAFNTPIASGPGDDPCEGLPDEIASDPVAFQDVVVPVPDLSDAQVTCTRVGIRDLHVSWQPLWRGFSDRLTVRLEHLVGDGEPVVMDIEDVLLGETEVLVEGVEPIGAYRSTVIAEYDAQEVSASCESIAFSPTMTVDALDAGIGMESFDIPIRAAGVFHTVSGFEFDLEYPDFVTIVGHAPSSAGAGRSRIQVRVGNAAVDPDPDGDHQSTGDVVLTALTATIPPDFGLAGMTGLPLVISNARLRFEGSDVFHDVTTVDGELSLRGRYTAIDTVEADASSAEPIRIAVRLTFTAPPENPNYRFNAFTVHLRFPPRELEVLPVSVEDQQETAVGGEGFFVFPAGDALERANSLGDIKIGWIGFNFSNPEDPDFLEPVTNEEILVLYFRSVLPEGTPATFSPVTFFYSASGDQPTAFFPEQDVPGVPDVEAFFDGGVQFRSSGPSLVAASVDPAYGPLTGGNVVRLLGTGFPVGEPGEAQVRLVPPVVGTTLVADPGSLVIDSERELLFRVPDSGLRELGGALSITYGVELEVGGLVSSLAEAYSFEVARVVGTDVGSVRDSGGDLIRVTGAGFSPSTTAAFEVSGFEVPIAADVLRVREDGRQLLLVSRAMPGPAPGESFRSAILRITVPDVATLTVPAAFRILGGETSSELVVESVSPAESSYCGGTEVLIRGDGFTASAEVEFGGVPASSVSVLNRNEILAVVPPRTAPGPVSVAVRGDAGVGTVAFSYVEPPPFVRGDVNADGFVDVTDVVTLSGLLLGQAEAFPVNRDALDVNDDGEIHFGDVTAVLSFLWEGGAPPPPPYPDPGQDPDNLADGICQ